MRQIQFLAINMILRRLEASIILILNLMVGNQNIMKIVLILWIINRGYNLDILNYLYLMNISGTNLHLIFFINIPTPMKKAY